MADNRQIDQQQVRDHIDSVLQGCEQVFEKFFLAKFMGLEFEYLPAGGLTATKRISKLPLR